MLRFIQDRQPNLTGKTMFQDDCLLILKPKLIFGGSSDPVDSAFLFSGLSLLHFQIYIWCECILKLRWMYFETKVKVVVGISEIVQYLLIFLR